MEKEQTFHHFHVQHYCPLALALERLGDRWSFLIVRDLKRGPLRFTDLQRYLAGITPKRLTLDLRALESEGIVQRESEEGRREVWYHLTEKGKGLIPAIEALTAWSVENIERTPFPGETVYPEHMMFMVSILRNKYGRRLSHPVKWTFDFGSKGVFTIGFDGEAWSTQQVDAPDADVRIQTQPEIWARLLAGPQDEQARLLASMSISGEPERVNEFLASSWSVKRH